MALADQVRISRRFQRSIRIDTDIGNPAALEGFVCPRSYAGILETMVEHIDENGQGAFTWTGPYGSGKSSLVVALSAALKRKQRNSDHTKQILGERTYEKIRRTLKPRTRGWRVLPVVGRRDRPAQVIGEAIWSSKLTTSPKTENWTDGTVLDTIEEIAESDRRSYGGLLVFIDEMGKFLEGAANDNTDLFLFQELAERASRSGKRLIVVGILHQAFEEYAHRLTRESRDEWSKIQGRFVDLAVNVDLDEQIDLISRAIECDHRPVTARILAANTAALVKRDTIPDFEQTLEKCWPLHPIVACLLGPISRRRYGQNQRSIFAFLNSAEPFGFHDFLRNAEHQAVYEPDRLWDYLRVNLEPSILASPDGHRWALAAEVIERCEAVGGDDVHLRILKVLAVIGMFQDRSALGGSLELLKLVFPDYIAEIENKLEDLDRWSFVIYRKFADSFSIYEGSDFDIDTAVENAHQNIGEMNASVFRKQFEFQPIIAKRHYHETGALRWFDTTVLPLAEADCATREYQPRNGAIGCFILAIATQSESEELAEKVCEEIVQQSRDWDIVVGLSQHSGGIPTQLRELVALEWVRDQMPELQGDRVARMEVQAHIDELQNRLSDSFDQAFNGALWYRNGAVPVELPYSRLNMVASSLADSRFNYAPRIFNELLGRTKSSSSAVAARNILIRLMVANEGKTRLGIEGYPAEGGLFASVLDATGLYHETIDGWRFVAPSNDSDDPGRLWPAWNAALSLLTANAHRGVTVEEIYEVWRRPPFGIKEGLLPVLSVAFYISNQRNLALYRDGLFQVKISELDVDFLVRDPADIQLRWMELSDTSRALLADLAQVVRELDEENPLTHLEPLDVARGLVAIYDQLPQWVGRTQQLSSNAKRIRQLFKLANDPNRLIFDDIPSVDDDGVDTSEGPTGRQAANLVGEGLRELKLAYPTMLNRLRDLLLGELRVPNTSTSMLSELRDRAENIREVSGDHRLEAFIIRLARFHGKNAEIEDIAGMAVNKPTRNWVDSDVDKAALQLAELAEQFVHTEAFARVKGRRDKRHSMAVVVDISRRGMPLHDEFDVSDMDESEVGQLIDRIDQVLDESGEKRRNVILAALASLMSKRLDPSGDSRQMMKPKKRKEVS
ncbi:MAG: ATP-binding protein [Gemmatimonadetes bacterium]|nr:ATP-binding protein [Gemmatimonadota bacterium]